MGRAVPSSAHARRAAFPLAVLALAAYFAYHAVIGDFGLIALQRMGHEQAELRAELAVLGAERERLEHKVMLMRPEGLDPDMLDERARETLNLAHPDELVIMRTGR